jgi:hypothetical protein
MAVQNHSNHRRYVPGFHIVSATLCIVAFIASIFNLVHNWFDPANHLSAAIIFIITIILCLFSGISKFYVHRTGRLGRKACGIV